MGKNLKPFSKKSAILNLTWNLKGKLEMMSKRWLDVRFDYCLRDTSSEIPDQGRAMKRRVASEKDCRSTSAASKVPWKTTNSLLKYLG
jgi:hypothetical protein